MVLENISYNCKYWNRFLCINIFDIFYYWIYECVLNGEVTRVVGRPSPKIFSSF